MKNVKIKKMDLGVMMKIVNEELCDCGCNEMMDIEKKYCFNNYDECMKYLNGLYYENNNVKMN